MNDAVPVLNAASCQPVQVNITNGKIDPALMDGETRTMWVQRLKDALGTESDDLAWYAVLTLFKACRSPEALKLNAMIETVRAGCPRDPQEMMLLVQMAAVSQRLQEAIISEITAPTTEDRLIQTKVVRQYGQLYARQMEALRKYRRDGNQQITVVRVEHANAVGIKAG